MRSTCTSLSSAIKMATFNAKSFEKKLNAMDLSQTSVQTVSLWIIHHRQHVKEILSIWIDMMKKGKIDRKLVLFYLANDVVQNSRKKSKELIQYFGKAFREIIVYMNEKKINSQVERVFKIWEERKVYEKEFVDKLRSLHSGAKKEKIKVPEAPKAIEKLPEAKVIKPKASAKPLPADFKMSTVMNMVVSMKELESEISMQDSQMSSLKVDASDLEAVKQVKDRSGVNKFVKEFEESKEKLDLYCGKLSRCINDKRALIDMLSHSETYYDEAYEEAKVIVHAYKTFGSRLSSMKRKVESKVRKLKMKWEEKQKEMEERKSSKVEYEVEPISDAEEQTEFQPIGDLVSSGLKSLAAKKAEDPSVDNIDVLDMDLGSDSEDEIPDGPLYDPSSVMYDPNDAGKDLADSTEGGDNSNTSLINIPNPEDVFKNIMGQNDSTRSSKPMGIMIDGKLQTVSLSAGNMIIGTDDQQTKSVVHMKVQESSTGQTSSDAVSIVATEPSGTLLSNEAMSPISDDSVPSPEGTPEGLVLEQDQAQHDNIISKLNMGTVPSSTFQGIMQSAPFQTSDQFSLASSNWSTMATNASLSNLDPASNPHLGGIPDLPPPPVFPGLPNPAGQLSFDQGFIGDQLPIGSTIGHLPPSSNMIGQFPLGGSGLPFSQADLSLQMSVSENFPLMSTASSTTPTQDESEENTIRPIDILSQLLNKGKKVKKSRSSEKSEKSDRAHGSEHRKSKDHSKHRKRSSSRRQSGDRRHSSEASGEHGESGHGSARKSHHRRRGHSRGREMHSEDRSSERRDGSVDDNSEDSYLRSPKMSRLTRELSNDADAAGLVDDEGKEHVVPNDSLDNRPTTIFDRRRVEREQAPGTKADSAAFKKEGSHQGDTVQNEGKAEQSHRPELHNQFSTDSDVFVQHQKSFDGQTQGDHLEPIRQVQMNSTSAEPWTPTATPQKQDNFYYNAQRSPTPEMDKFQGDPVSQFPQSFVPSSFQPSGIYVPASMPQYDIQPAFASDPMLASQSPLGLQPVMPQGFPQNASKEASLQPGAFDMHPVLNQAPFLQGEQPLLPENRGVLQQQRLQQNWDRPSEGLSYHPDLQHRKEDRISGSSNDIRFQPVEAQMHLIRPGDMVPAALQPPSSPFSPDRPLPIADNSFNPGNQQVFRPMRPGQRHEVPQQREPYFAGYQGDMPESEANMAAEFQKRLMSKNERNTQDGNFSHGEKGEQRFQPRPGLQPLGNRNSIDGSVRDFPGRQNLVHSERQDFLKGDDVIGRHTNLSFPKRTPSDNQMPHNGSMQGHNQDSREHFDGMEHDSQASLHSGSPHHGQLTRNRFRHPGPGMRGPRPFRSNRPEGFPQQRPRFRPPLRPRLPQGYAPRRPVF